MNQPTAPIRIVVVDAHVLFAECLCLGLSQRGHRTVQVAPPARASSVAVMLAPILRERPDVVTVNIARSAGHDAMGLIHPLALSEVQVMVVTEEPDAARWGQALSLGARAVLPKDAPFASVAAAVRRLHQGLRVTSAEEHRSLVGRYRSQSSAQREQRARLETLSAREAEILSHLMLGRAVREISRAGFVSEATVRTQVRSVLSKLEVPSQLAAVALAWNSGWAPRDVGRTRGSAATARASRAADAAAS